MNVTPDILASGMLYRFMGNGMTFYIIIKAAFVGMNAGFMGNVLVHDDVDGSLVRILDMEGTHLSATLNK